MTSAYLTDVRVYIAFDSGYRTPAADRTWTEVTTYVEAEQGISITRGRADESSEVSASTLSLVLDNKDGRFTPARAASPYYPNVKVGRPIKVTSTHDSVEYVRFVGYVDEWPVVWDGTDATAYAPITASSRFARMAASTEMGTVLEETIRSYNPLFYYPMGEPEGSVTAGDQSGYGQQDLALAGTGTDPTFGTATFSPYSDALTGVLFGSGKHLTSAIDLNDTAPSDFTLMCFYYTADDTRTGADFLEFGGISFYLEGDLIRANCGGGSYVESSDAMTQYASLFGRYTSATDTFEFFKAGLSQGTVSGVSAFLALSSLGLYVGRDPADIILHHVAGFTSALSNAAIEEIDLAAQGSFLFPGETAGERLERLASFDDIPSAELDIDPGAAADMSAALTQGQGLLAYMQATATSDGGVLFDGKDGALTYRDRTHRYTQTPAFTLDAELAELGSGIAPTFDRQQLINDVTVSLISGEVVARRVDRDSRDDYGLARTSLELLTTDETEPANRAGWIVSRYAEPAPRIASLTVDIPGLIGNAGADPADILSADIGTRFAVTNLPSQARSTDEAFYIEGYTETITHDSHVLALNVTPGFAFDVFIFGTSGFESTGTDPFAY